MGMDPASIGLMAAMLGSSAIGGLTAPEGQEMQSFAGKGKDVDPTALLGEGTQSIRSLLDSFIGRANEPVTMKTTVNPLPSFVGGGLPMPISAPGMDAGRLNPASLTTPGAGLRRSFSPAGSRTPSPDAEMTGRIAQPRQNYARGNPGAAYGAGQQSLTGDGMGQTDPAAAAEMLLRQLQGG